MATERIPEGDADALAGLPLPRDHLSYQIETYVLFSKSGREGSPMAVYARSGWHFQGGCGVSTDQTPSGELGASPRILITSDTRMDERRNEYNTD